jgi:hypothetical protein
LKCNLDMGLSNLLVSFTPGFSQVPRCREPRKPFKRFSISERSLITRLKPGVNERKLQIMVFIAVVELHYQVESAFY